VHERYRRQTDRRTDGRAIAYSEREREFTFANHKLGGFCVGLEIFLADSPLPIHSSKLSSAFKPRLAYSAVAELLLQELCNLLRWATVPQESGPKVRVLYPSPLGFGGAGSPSNTMQPDPRPITVPSGILIHQTVCTEYTNVTDRTDRTTVQ